MSTNSPVVRERYASQPGAPYVMSDRGIASLRESAPKLPNHRYHIPSGERHYREETNLKLEFALVRTDAPGVWTCKTHDGAFLVEAENRRAAYITASCRVHGCPLPGGVCEI
jgi:hypothetical protein